MDGFNSWAKFNGQNCVLFLTVSVWSLSGFWLFPSLRFGPCMEDNDKGKACFWQRKIFLTVADLKATVMSDLWPLSSSFIWTLLLSVLRAFFFFFYSPLHSTSTSDLTVTLCNLGWPSDRPSKISCFSTNWQNTLTKKRSSKRIFWTVLFPGHKLMKLEISFISYSSRTKFCDVCYICATLMLQDFWDILELSKQCGQKVKI